jgi:fumarate hydratase class I
MSYAAGSSPPLSFFVEVFMPAKEFSKSLSRLISETSVNLATDVRRLIDTAVREEDPQSLSRVALDTICQNIDMAVSKCGALCQDTGMPTFLVDCPIGFDERSFERLIVSAVKDATRVGLLRPNSVDPITGQNSGDNVGPGTPVVHFHQHDNASEIVVRLALKGGGSENMSQQYSLPCELPQLGRANRDLEGVRKCVMHAVYAAQGQGCAPGYLGVCVGGDRTSGFGHAKAQLFRDAFDLNPNGELAALEKRVVEDANKLGIGALGLGGKSTLLGCKIGTLNRVPASFFVSVMYQCWAFRRLGVVIDAQTGTIKRWLYRDESSEIKKLAAREGVQLSGREVRVRPPLTEAQAREIRVGDVVVIDGPIHTGRDEMHKYLIKNPSPVDLNGHVIYHCGPVMLKDASGQWKVSAAGPTTSIREEPYEAEVMERCGIRGIIGKGGMGKRTLEALQKFGGVYLTAVGGAAQIYAEKLPRVDGVDLLDRFGIPEAMWHYQAEGFATVCTMDSHGGSLHAIIDEASRAELAKFK